MLVGTGPDDEWLKDVHGALEDVAASSTSMEESALDDIIAQLEEGKTWEDEDYGEVYDQSEAAQGDIDKALLDRLGFDVTRADEEANRERETLERLLKSRLDLTGIGMREEGATSRAMMQIEGDRRNAETMARTNLTNYAADPSKWADIEILFDDIINSFDKGDPMQDSLRDAKQRVGVGMASSIEAGQRGNLPVTSEQRDRRVGITSQAQATAMIEALSASGALSQIPPELLARIIG